MNERDTQLFVLESLEARVLLSGEGLSGMGLVPTSPGGGNFDQTVEVEYQHSPAASGVFAASDTVDLASEIGALFNDVAQAELGSLANSEEPALVPSIKISLEESQRSETPIATRKSSPQYPIQPDPKGELELLPEASAILLPPVTEELTVTLKGSNPPPPTLVTIDGTSPAMLPGAAGNQIYKVTAMVNTTLDEQSSGGDADTLDFSSFTTGLTFAIDATGVTVTDGTHTLIAKHIENLKAGSGADTFIIEKGGQLKGEIDGGLGVDVLSYDSPADAKKFTSPVTVVVDTVAGGGLFGGAPIPSASATGIDAKVLSVENYVGGTKGDKLTGTTFDEVLEGAGGNDELNGAGGNDTLKGQAGDDKLKGGPGNDFLHGGADDDTYLFAENWGPDKLTERTGDQTSADAGGNDTLDFSAVTKALVFILNPSTSTGIKVDDKITPLHTLRDRFFTTDGVKYIENVIAGPGANEFKFEAPWDVDLSVKNRPVALTPNLAILDFTAISHDLEFTIDGPGVVTVLDTVTKKKVVADGIKDIKGGKGNNTYKFKGAGSISGVLDGGVPAIAPATATSNVLDYSDYSAGPVTVDFKLRLATGVAAVGAVAPVNEK